MHLVRERLGWQKLYTIHRLDRETSGVVLFAKTHQMAQQMAALFRDKQIRKEYRAVVTTHYPRKKFWYRNPLDQIDLVPFGLSNRFVRTENQVRPAFAN